MNASGSRKYRVMNLGQLPGLPALGTVHEPPYFISPVGGAGAPSPPIFCTKQTHKHLFINEMHKIKTRSEATRAKIEAPAAL